MRYSVLARAFALALSFATLAHAEPKRPPQDYGRPKPKTSAGMVLAWPLRVVLAPAWVVFELVLRQPHRLLVTSVENSSAVKSAQDTTSGGPWKDLSILPAAEFDVGLKPLLGLNASWRYHHNEVALQAGTWGSGYVVARASERYEFTTGQRLTFETAFSRRRDLPFYGLGPRSRDQDRVRYDASSLRALVGYSDDFWRQSRVHVGVGARGLWFGDGACCDEPSLQTVERQASSISPDVARRLAPGYGQDYAAATQRFELTLDSRRPNPERGAALLASVHEEATFADPGAPSARTWLSWGGMVGTAIDLTGTRRVLTLGAHVDFVDPLRGEVPFTDLATLGGTQGMLGYLRGRLVGRSALVARAEYAWPIWIYLDGMLHAAVGNVYGAHLSDFDAGALRYSLGVGVRSIGKPSARLEVTVAVGSEPFDSGGKPDSVRFLVGTQHGL